MAVPTRSGCVTAHSSERIPPIEPPMTAAQRRMPSWSASRASTSTWSRTVTNGNREPHGRPSGAADEGPVVPWQPPRTLDATTNHRSVSSGRPGPIRPSHQPGVGWPGPAGPLTWLSPVSACSTRTALSARGVERAPRLVGDGRPRAAQPPVSRSSGPTAANCRLPGSSPGSQAPPAATRSTSDIRRPWRPRTRPRGRPGCRRCARCRPPAGPARA